ncbi:hypothetical protein SAMN05443529_12084 [Desulfosporosinus hippei DSM 8344]|uniref:Uncharacterized protein n=1 Tax=Desulfosporosinus hippei DSM 8344 TaxID=1121419 RepID=A0A1G8FUR4_9FIRM|nr:hypothetical protein SAMN05443529_12084 [Desulfosporosinus hippei DSM 8344]
MRKTDVKNCAFKSNGASMHHLVPPLADYPKSELGFKTEKSFGISINADQSAKDYTESITVFLRTLLSSSRQKGLGNAALNPYFLKSVIMASLQ